MYLGQVGLGIALLFTFGFCGVAQLLDLLLLPDAVKEANQRLGFSGSEGTAPITPSPSIMTTRAPQARSASVRSPDNDELDELLHQAAKSVSRTDNIIDEP